MTTDEAVLGDCANSYNSDGARITTGNCMGGATSINGGVYITEEPELLIAEIPMQHFLTNIRLNQRLHGTQSG
jgi:hypothetical protein